ncbi:MAG: M16 family metallopeptidase, partial [Hyphomicrobiaceae bacterium]
LAVMTAFMLIFLTPHQARAADSGVTSFKLANGLEVCVIPDHRVPVVTHMVWYRVGAADDPPKMAGTAHFLEHLMFKGTTHHKTGDFTKIVTELGGRHNAHTTHDTTSYYQRTDKKNLKQMMELEADRMANLQFVPKEVTTERSVVQEERRGTIGGNPISALNEKMLAGLYDKSPYRRPVLGTAKTIAGLTLANEKAFYKAHYGPNNAILVVAGDVTPDEVRRLAEEIYGKIPRNPNIKPRHRAKEPPHKAPRHVTVEDARAGAPIVLRYYRVPGLTGPPKVRAALSVLARILGGDDTSRLYRKMVLTDKVAAQAGADYQGGGLDESRMALLAVARGKVGPKELAAEFDKTIKELISTGVSEKELQRAKTVLETNYVFNTDNQEARAKRYGQALDFGLTVADVEAELPDIMKVTAADVLDAAKTYLNINESITGYLIKPQ